MPVVNTMIVLNGPPRCGKDTLVRFLTPAGYVHRNPGQSIKRIAHAECGHTFTDDQKDLPQDVLDGATPRSKYIEVGSRDAADPLLFVRAMLDGLPDGVNVVCESFKNQEQFDAFVEMFRPAKVVLALVSRPGVTWTDYRRPFTHNGPTMEIVNDGSIDDLAPKAAALLALAS